MAGTTTYYGISYPTSTDYVKDGASAIQTVATGFDSAVAIPTYNAQTGTTYTFALTDVGKTVTASNAAAQTYTIPPTASVAWTANTTLRVLNLGAGVVTFAAGAGVTVTNTAQTLAQYQSAQLVRTGLNAWTVTPDSGQTGSGLTLVSATTIGTAVSSVNVTSAFSTTYDNYKISIAGGLGSTSLNLNLKLGATATGYYSGQTFCVYNNTTPGGRINNNATSWTTVGYGSSSSLSFDVELLNPFLAKNTMLRFMVAQNATNGDGGGGGGFLNDSTSYTDFTITPSTGTLTGGTIYVYGYNK
jgi:hypothetical protein